MPQLSIWGVQAYMRGELADGLSLLLLDVTR
jgi:hypothetical protein